MARTRPSTHAPADHLERLTSLLAEIDSRLDRMRGSLAELDDAGTDVGADDDEGGGEADSTGVERDRLKAAIAHDVDERHAAVEALERAETPEWATCTECGGDIGEARLEALPTTQLCVSCKAKVW
ncbi:MAG: TraR/DksA family transcriptional regulator [Acidimicrobiales bacterium]